MIVKPTVVDLLKNVDNRFQLVIDIVKEQIKIAAGEKLKIKQKNVQFKGHSIECRINAENPRKKFR